MGYSVVMNTQVVDYSSLIAQGQRRPRAPHPGLRESRSGRWGYCVVIGDILEEEGRRTVQDINETAGRALFERLDVTREEDWQRIGEETISHFGGLDILVNNAGILHWASVEGTTLEKWNKVMDVNTLGVFLGS